jgi:hypothetical protein
LLEKLSEWTTVFNFAMGKKRELFFYKQYFKEFYQKQRWKVQKKILWALEVVESLEKIPEIYFKHLENTQGLFEIRVQPWQ